MAKKPPAFRQRRQAKGDAALILASPTVKPPAAKQSTAKVPSASAQELAQCSSMLARSSANAIATHIDNEISGGTQDDSGQIGTVVDSEEGSGDTGSGTENVSHEYKNALRSAESYLKYSDFSKTKLYEQLTSDYGSKYPADAAQYAIDNVKADWKAKALDVAKAYHTL